jgi:hypothetical protein
MLLIRQHVHGEREILCTVRAADGEKPSSHHPTLPDLQKGSLPTGLVRKKSRLSIKRRQAL